MESSNNENSNTGEVGPPATTSVINDREEDLNLASKRTVDDSSSLNPDGRLQLEGTALKTRGRILKIATWNVRTLYQAGKFDNILQEMGRLKIDILGLSETRWTDDGKITRDKHTMLYSGGEDHQSGVGVIMKNSIAKSLLGYWPISDRVMLVKLQGKPFNINLIQVYAPTKEYSEDINEAFYEQVETAFKYVKNKEYTIVMGDFNAKVGNKKHKDIIGSYGLGKRNERGERLIQFCEEHNLVVTNILFQHPPRRLYTWKSPGDIVRNQIDYILVSQRYRNSLKQVKTYPGADVNSDHNPVIAKLEIKLKNIRQFKRKEQLDLNLLKQESIRNKYNVEVRYKYELLVNQDQIQEPNDQLNVENKWNIFKTSILTALQETLPKKMNDKKKIWMTDEILVKMSESRKFKNSKDIEKYDRLNREIIHECRAAKTQYLEDQCKIIEDLEKTHKSKELHDRINKVTNSKKQNRGSGNVKDKDGHILFDHDLIASRWVEYISDLYDDKNRPEMPTFNETPGNSILKEEVERVIRDMKHGKATGPDELSAEALKALDDINVKLVTELCNRIYESGCIPTELKQSITKEAKGSKLFRV